MSWKIAYKFFQLTLSLVLFSIIITIIFIIALFFTILIILVIFLGVIAFRFTLTAIRFLYSTQQQLKTEVRNIILYQR